MQKYRIPGQPLTAQMQALLYYARKRTREREMAGSIIQGGGYVEQNQSVGIVVDVELTLQ